MSLPKPSRERIKTDSADSVTCRKVFSTSNTTGRSKRSRITTRLNPDRDTRKVDVFTTGAGSDFVAQLEQTLDKANYERVTQEVISAAMEESSLFKLKIDINFYDFDEAVLFARGEGEREEQFPHGSDGGKGHSVSATMIV